MSTRNQECMIYILEEYGPTLSTSQVIKYARKHPKICSGCGSGNDVIMAGLGLMKEGKIKREVAKGGYLWILNI